MQTCRKDTKQRKARSERITAELEAGATREWSLTRNKVFLETQKSANRNLDKIAELGKRESYPASTRKLMKAVDDDYATLEHMLR